MAITATLRLDNGSTTNATSYVTGSAIWLGQTTLLLWVEYSKGDGTTAGAPSSITGVSTTWTLVDSIAYDNAGGSRNGLALFQATGTTTFPSTLTINFGYTATGCRWNLIEVGGGPAGSGAIVQTVKTSGSVAAASTLTLTYAAMETASSRQFVGYGMNTSTTDGSIEAGWTALGQSAHATPGEDIGTAWRSGSTDTTFVLTNGGVATVDAGMIGVELRPLHAITGSADADTAIAGVKVGVGAITGSADADTAVDGDRVAGPSRTSRNAAHPGLCGDWGR